jgi:hypothetical protein
VTFGFPDSCRLPIRQTLAFNFLQSLNRALAICHIAEIPSVIKLGKVKRQMLLADAMECADHTAFEQGE